MRIGCPGVRKRNGHSLEPYPAQRRSSGFGWRQRLEFFPGLEADGLAGRDANLLSGTRITADAGLARLHREDTKAAEFDAFPACQSVLHRLEYGFHGLLGFAARDAGLLYDGVDDIELDHTILRYEREAYARQGFAGCQAPCCVIRCAPLDGPSRRVYYHREVRMAVKSDKWIRRMAAEHKMIEPYADRQVRQGVISYGVSSYGYDMRVADEFRIFTNVNSSIVDPKHFDAKSFVEFQGDVCIVPPNSFALGRSVEYFRIPRNVLTLCVGKSTYARCGIIVNVTPFEPEWEGFVTLEISNTTPLPAKIYANEGLCQVIFFESDEDCEVSYKDKKGKYQAQGGIVLPRL